MISSKSAIDILNQNQVVALPTETVYGLAARIDSESALRLIFSTKERPFFDPLIVHVSSIEMAKNYVNEWPEIAQILAEKFWPGPLTMVLPKNEKVNPLITSGLESVGLRFPRHPAILEIIESLQVPLAAPSANLFGKTSPTEAAHVIKEFQGKVPVLDGGPCEVGLESTVIGVIEDKIVIYRPGRISAKDIEKALEDNNLQIKIESAPSQSAPGQLENHYMPEVPLVLAGQRKGLENFLEANLKLRIDECAELEINESAEIFARKLYSELRNLSQKSKALFVIKDEKLEDPLWEAIWDRLHKAASLYY